MRRIALPLIPILAASCASSPPPAPPPPPPPPGPVVETATLAEIGVDPGWMDRSVDPCGDFYRFACGGFLDRAEIPADLPSWRPATQMRKANEDFLHDTLEAARKQPGDPVLGRLGAFYASCMDEPAIEAAGTAPIQPLLDAVAGIRDAASLYDAIATLHRAGVWAAFALAGAPDGADSQRMIGWIDQSGLGLPERDYYLSSTPRAIEIRGLYQAHIARMFALAGDPPAGTDVMAKAVLRSETELAKIARPIVERRDSLKTYHKIDRAGVIAAAKSFPWQRYFAALGVPELSDISVTSPVYLTAMAALLAKGKPVAWKPYLRWRVLATYAPGLTRGFVDESFALRKVLSGQRELEPRWKTCVRATNDTLAELLAQPFVAAKFSAKAREMTLDLIEHIRGAMRDDLGKLAWMDDATRTAALAKLDKMRNVVGRPAQPKAYDFPISATDYGGNAIAAVSYEVQRNLHKIGRPVDPEDWEEPPVTVDAFYNPSHNTMNFPAGILQPPLFSEHHPAAVNYGHIGSTIGHELTHGFDDDGARYDATGNLRDWWSADSKREFKARTTCVIEQYNRYEPLPGLRVNGALTVGENIADIGGLKLAFAAYRLARAGKVPLHADGFTEDQVFFIAHAQGWCDKTRPEIVETNLRSDPHTPRRFRVLGAVADQPEFATAFKCAAEKPMNPANRCEVW